MALIETKDLGRKYEGRAVLEKVNLAVEAGEVFSLIGPTGTGKTTLIRLLDLLETPSSGSIRIDGIDVTGDRRKRLEVRRRMAYVQQRPLLFNATVHENVACGLGFRGIRGETARKKIETALDLVGLSGYGGRDARTLSGGRTSSSPSPGPWSSNRRSSSSTSRRRTSIPPRRRGSRRSSPTPSGSGR